MSEFKFSKQNEIFDPDFNWFMKQADLLACNLKFCISQAVAFYNILLALCSAVPVAT